MPLCFHLNRWHRTVGQSEVPALIITVFVEFLCLYFRFIECTGRVHRTGPVHSLHICPLRVSRGELVQPVIVLRYTVNGEGFFFCNLSQTLVLSVEYIIDSNKPSYFIFSGEMISGENHTTSSAFFFFG